MHARKYCPSQTEYYFLGRYLMYGTSKQNAFLFSETSRALIDSAETLPTKVRLTLL